MYSRDTQMKGAVQRAAVGEQREEMKLKVSPNSPKYNPR
jgi:hypothetical protein